jgi:KDO2-lipid IV(A) lauroyltransferase
MVAIKKQGVRQRLRVRQPAFWGRILLQRAAAAALRHLFSLLGRINVVTCSNLGGGAARHIGPFLPVNRVADGNLQRALPALDAAARRRIILGMWDNLGRTAAELAHLPALRRTKQGPGWEVEGEHHLLHAMVQHRQILFFSAHLGNWELILPIAAALGLPIGGFYRAASNPFVDRVIQAQRQRAAPHVPMFAKGGPGARAALRHLLAGGSLGGLVDQKMNDGIAAPFFGQMAMTASALPQLALRFATPLLPVHIVRTGPARFLLIIEAPLSADPSGDRAEAILALTTAMNATVERWIREQPQSWLWMHRRWPNRPLMDSLVGEVKAPRS